MRTSVHFGFVLLVAALVACGGGGGSSVVPAGGTSVHAPQPSLADAKLVLHIPAPSAQSRARRPFYISPATQSLEILAFPNSQATPSPLPTAQIFPVAVPSPCATAPGGGETCTFDVQVPYGNDIFILATYATASPGSSSAPLSIAEGTATVTLNPSVSPSPLSFAMNAVVASVAVNVPSPDPSNTPNTQLFTAGVAASPVPLTITAYDAAGNSVLSDPTTPFFIPIAVQVSPPPGTTSSGGFSLALHPACASSSSSPSSLVIGCAADLANATLAYDGSIDVDSSNHIVDNVAIAPHFTLVTPTQSPAPVAHAVLQSNVLLYSLPIGSSYPNPARLQALSNGTIAYAYKEGVTWGVGTFDPSSGTVSAPVTNTTTTADVQAFAISADGSSVWAFDYTTKSMMCWPGIATVSGAPSKTLPIQTSLGYPIRVNAMAFDGSGNLWYEGVDTSVSQNWAGFIPVTAACGAPASAPNAQVAIFGDSGDYSSRFAATGSGAAWNSGYQGLYTFTTASSSASAIPPAAGVSSYGMGGGVAVDSTGAIYMAYTANNSLPPTTADIEKLSSAGASGPLSSLLTLTPGSAGISSQYASAGDLSVFSDSSGADRMAYVDQNFGALGFIDDVQSTPSSELVTLPYAGGVYATTFTATGEPVAFYGDSTGHMYLARVLATTTWNVPVTTFAPICSNNMAMTVLQRGASSAPFAVTVSGAGTHAFPSPNAFNTMMTAVSNGSHTITVTDASGRTRTFNATVASQACP